MVIKTVASLVLLMVSIVTLACESKAPSVSPIEITALIGQMRDMAWAEEVVQAQVLIEQQRSHHDQSSTGWLVATSWLGRGASFAEQWDVAEEYAREAYDGSVVLLNDRALDAESQLPTALGAGIEVLSRALDAKGDRAGALEFLRGAHESYKGSSLETRIQKNVLLLSPRFKHFTINS